MSSKSRVRVALIIAVLLPLAFALAGCLDLEGNAGKGSDISKAIADNPNFAMKWAFRADGIAESPPAIGKDGTIYFGISDTKGENSNIEVGETKGKFYALSKDGVKKWEFKTEGWVMATPAIGEDGTIYFGTMGPGRYDGRLYALNPDGSKRWEFKTKGWVNSSPAIAKDGTIYFGSDNGKLYALSPDGTKKWEFSVRGEVESLIVGNAGTIYFGTGEGKLYALSPDGTEKWTLKSAGEEAYSLVLGKSGLIYLNSLKQIGADSWNEKYTSWLSAITPSGNEKWRFKIAGTATEPSEADDGTVYIGSNEGLFAIKTDGKIKWKYDAGGEIDSLAVGRDGTIYFGSAGDFSALNKDGAKKWGFTIDGWFLAITRSMSDDRLLYLNVYDYESTNGILFAIELNQKV